LAAHKGIWLRFTAFTLALGCALIGPQAYANTSLGPWNVVTTVAGNGTAGTPGAANGDGGPATAAQLNGSRAIAFDSRGSMYIADLFNNAVRRVNPDGIITTFAGNGSPNYAGDNGPAVNASLYYPTALYMDAVDNLYIADNQNHCIRKVDSNGIISTVVGTGTPGYSGNNGLATAAQINGPNGIWQDSTGNLYIAEYANHCIRKVDTAGIITTIAGTGVKGYNGDNIAATAAQLNFPEAVFPDNLGNIYIADFLNYRIRKIDPGGIITTIAGNGVMIHAGDNGPAIAASIWSPSDVKLDALGNIYIAARGNHRIRKVDQAGIITTIAGTGEAAYGGDNGPASKAKLNGIFHLYLDNFGNLYVAEQNNNRIRKILSDQTNISSATGSITLEAATTYTAMQGVAGSQIDLNGYALAFGKNNGTTIDSTFNGIIQGNGGLTVKAGTGCSLTLGGVNTYSGGTVVQSGTLALSGAGALANNGAVTITGGTLDISAAADQTVGDVSSSSGTMINLGARTLTFGTAQDSTIAGTVTGIGGLTKQGTGRVIVRGALDHTGSTTINAGEMVVSGSIVGNIDNNDTLSFSSSDPMTYGGVITGTGSVVQRGSGSLTLTGTSTYAGDTVVESGTLILNGSVASDVVLNNGGRLAGTGTINGDVSGLGKIAPGHQGVGTLTVAGNYTPSAGSTLAIHLRPTTAAPVAGFDCSHLDVGGAVTLTGTTLELSAANGTYQEGASYPIVTTAGGLTGTFSNTNALMIFGPYQATLVYNAAPNTHALRLNRITFTTPTEGLGDYLNSLPTPAVGSDLGRVMSALAQLSSPGAQAEAIRSLSPEPNQIPSVQSADNSALLNSITGARLSSLRSGPQMAAVTLPSFRSSVKTLQHLMQPKPGALTQPGLQATSSGVQAEAKDAFMTQLHHSNGQGGMWLHTLGQYAKHKRQNGFTAKAAGALAGMDTKLATGVFMGGGMGVTQTHLSFARNGGHGHVRSYYAMGYGTFFTGAWHMDVSVVAALNRLRMHRAIAISGLEPRTASNRHNGYEVTPHLGIGYSIPVQAYTLEPFMGVDYVWQREEGYREQGAGSLNCALPSRHSSLLRSEAGLSLTRSFKLEAHTLTLQGKLSYVNKHARKVRSLASFIDQQGRFTLSNNARTQHQIAPGVEATVQDHSRLYVSVRYNAELSKTAKAHQVTLKLGKKF
jgi:autotransporter-associated beta strand repeat